MREPKTEVEAALVLSAGDEIPANDVCVGRPGASSNGMASGILEEAEQQMVETFWARLYYPCAAPAQGQYYVRGNGNRSAPPAGPAEISGVGVEGLVMAERRAPFLSLASPPILVGGQVTLR